MLSEAKHPFAISFITNPKLLVYFAIISLCLLVLYTTAIYVYRPYDNLGWDRSYVGVVGELEAKKAGFQVGDRVLEIDGEPIVDMWGQKPMYRPFVRAGDQVVYKVQRGEQTLTIPLTIGSYFDEPDYLVRLLIKVLLAVCFWISGTVLCIFTKSTDVRAKLIGCSWLLISVAIITGSIGAESQFWGYGIFMKSSFSLLFFVLIAQHIYFPAPTFTRTKRRLLVALGSGVSIVLVALTLIDDLYIKPRLNIWSHINDLTYVFFLLSLLVSIVLLFHNLFRAGDLDVRRQTGIVIAGTLLGFSPFLALNLLPSLLFSLYPINISYTLPFLIFIPLSYAYVIYQRKLLKLDLVINRFVVLFVVILLILLLSVLILGSLALWLNLSPELPLVGGLFTALFFILASGLEKRVQAGVNRILYGTHYDHTLVTSSLSSKLAQTLDRQALTYLLTGLFSEQMGIKQSALILVKHGKLSLQSDTDKFSCDADDRFCTTLLNASRPMRAQNLLGLLSQKTQEIWQTFGWGEIFAPLIFQNRLQGILVLGERNANDLYSEQDIAIIATVADQSALAFANIQHVEELDGLAQDFVRSEEEQRYKISQDLHDTVLQNLCVVKMGVTDPVLEKYLDDMMDRIRDTIKNQRPRTLDRGIVDATEELVDDMRKILPQGTHIIWRNYVNVPLQMSDELVTHLYRVAYEAILNAIKHANARAIRVSLEKIQDKLRLRIEDDGIGMANCQSPLQHYGLSGMFLRARMIKAQLDISSVPGDGTEITLETKICP